MAKKPTISTISSGYASNTQLNNNFSALRTGFDNTLSLDGSTPNAMNADFDMNSNDILNANVLYTDQLVLSGTVVTPVGLTASGASVVTDQFTGDDSTTAYVLSYAPQIKDHTGVFIDGVYQNKAGYSIAGTTLTFTEAPPLNSAIEVQIFRSLLIGTTAATNVSYNQGGTGAVDRTAQVKLQESVSVKDFGAVGDGVTDDTAAIAAAHSAATASSSGIFYPTGTYVCGNFKWINPPAIDSRNANWKIGSVVIPIPSQMDTMGEVTFYVNPTGSDTNNNGLTAVTPFQSIQQAIDAIPSTVKHRQTVQLSDGTHTAGIRNTNPLGTSSTVRAVRVLIEGKSVNGRDLIHIQGNNVDNTLCIISLGTDAYAAVYAEETNGTAVSGVTIDGQSYATDFIAIVQHRQGEMRVDDIKVIGNNYNGSRGFLAESGGLIEFDGVINITKTERAFTCLHGFMSFIGSSTIHDGGTATNPRTFEAAAQGYIYLYSGSLTVSNVERVAWCKSGYILIGCTAGSTASNVSAYTYDCTTDGEILAYNLSTTGGSRGVNCVGGKVTLESVTLANQTNSAVYVSENGTVVMNNSILSDNTRTKSLITSENGNITIKGTSASISGGFRGVYAKNSLLEVDEGVSIDDNSFNLDCRESQVRLVGTSTNPIICSQFTNNSLYFVGSQVFLFHVTIDGVALKTAIFGIGTQIYSAGGILIDAGYMGYDLTQNSSLTQTEDVVTSTITNATIGMTARRGSQIYYRASRMTTTGTGTVAVASGAEFALITSF
jgi:hypothetical protein